jgi:hypothetical protein
MKTYGEVDVYIHIFLTSALVGDEWSALCRREIVPGTHLKGGWVGPEPVWTAWRVQNFCPYRDSPLQPFDPPMRSLDFIVSKTLSEK